MRSSKSRSRSKANRPRTLGNIINRVFDSSGPEGKVRGTPQQIIEKYLILARDAQLSNDRVAAENFLQHAEHYTRLLSEAQREMAAEQEARQQQFQQNNQNRDQQNRDRGDRNDRRDGGEYRDQREPRFDQGRPDYAGTTELIEIASGADVIDLSGDDDAGLVETPEAFAEAPSAEPAAPVAEEPAPRPERAERPPRGERPPRADRAPKAEKPKAEAEGDAPEKADRGPRRPRGPRKPKAEGAPEAKPEAAE
ncbi:DUF4167 domain-containing protein [Neotabrizicola shimadae]|uniref:DUF4167 domain-containing protein n=1 Tax=Neotabrizicola shimadae TaxID=2807096 RepID=A0A8G1EEC2_9RHOB|nr:DUF4167 domain-containing protein [Neotabrizicola shimadae]QYZ71156.1 DUF4167 domain-containing protein [Neotabrizicola shimadae]